MRFPPVREFFLLGKALKSHGTEGQLRLLIEDRFKPYISPDAFIFFDLDGSKVPFRVTGVEEGQHFVVTLENFAGKQDSDAFIGKAIWIPLEKVRARHQQAPRHLQGTWEDYTLCDDPSGQSFTILRTEEYPQQLMAIIMFEGREILIPLHDQLIHSIDRKHRIIHMDIPEGLLNL